MFKLAKLYELVVFYSHQSHLLPPVGFSGGGKNPYFHPTNPTNPYGGGMVGVGLSGKKWANS